MTSREAYPRYRAATAAETFGRVLAGEDPRIAVGEFLDDWRAAAADGRAALVAEPIGDAGDDEDLRRWAAFVAAMVDHLCAQAGIAPPSWTAGAAFRLAEPWFLIPGWPLRAWQLITTPVPFRMRNIFGGDNLLDRA
jgi:hypothetical protein